MAEPRTKFVVVRIDSEVNSILRKEQARLTIELERSITVGEALRSLLKLSVSGGRAAKRF